MIELLRRLADASNARAARWRIYPVVAAIGVVAYVAIYGVGHLTGSSSYWDTPQRDEGMALMGYRYFVAADWHWPMFANTAIDIPYTTSVAFNDCIPLWAAINKLFATMFPPWEHVSARTYLASWHTVVYALQACFGVACVRSLGHRSWRAAIVTALFVLAVPAWIFRYGHPALSAHWIELWAIWLYLRAPDRQQTPRRLALEGLAMLAVGSSVTPYHPVMCLPIFGAALLRSRDVRSIAIWFPLGVATVVGATWLAGYFADEAAVAQWGFAKQSTNLLSWLVPVRSGIVGDARWIANVMATDWQHEGYCYFGLGFLGLLVLCVRDPVAVRDAIRRHAFLFAVALAFAALALSNHVYFGGEPILTYRVPKLLRWFAGQFRAPGRFVWLPMYVVLLFVLHRGLTWASSWRRFAIVAGLLIVQVVDVRGDWALQRAWTDHRSTNATDPIAWRPFVHAHAAVEIHPTFACLSGELPPAVFDLAFEVQLLASERALPINGTYNTRTIRRCDVEARAWATYEPRPDTLYVLLPQAAVLEARFPRVGMSCARITHAVVCSARRDPRALAR